jgi:hypothetical protein
VARVLAASGEVVTLDAALVARLLCEFERRAAAAAAVADAGAAEIAAETTINMAGGPGADGQFGPLGAALETALAAALRPAAAEDIAAALRVAVYVLPVLEFARWAARDPTERARAERERVVRGEAVRLHVERVERSLAVKTHLGRLAQTISKPAQ